MERIINASFCGSRSLAEQISLSWPGASESFTFGGSAMSNKIRVAVVGASGYTGEELVKILLDHPCVELVAVTSRQYAGKHVGEVFLPYEKTEGFEPAIHRSGSGPSC